MSERERPTQWPATVWTPYGRLEVGEREYVDLERQHLLRHAPHAATTSSAARRAAADTPEG